VRGSVVRGPVVIGRGTLVVDSFVGPYTSIGTDCELVDTEVENSVLLERARVVGIHRLVDSLIGREVEVDRCDRRPGGTRLLLGDHSIVSLP
jgi:glucose-1-phosphate thymidylyltransferase